MGAHSLDEARALGYHAMQFNLVVSTNESAVRLWSKLGFAIVGRIPAAFRHARRGLVDALVMHRFLDDGAIPDEAACDPAIRAAVSADAAAIAHLSGQLGYPQDGGAALHALRAIRTEGSGAVLVAQGEDGAVVGWIHVFLAHRLESEAFAEIGGLVVDETVRNRGIGARLVGAAEAWAAAHSAPTIRVRSNVKREDAHRFYAAHGYDVAKTQAVFVKRLGPHGLRP
jgi:GNAT superfamily N-acetyltransferase